MCLETGLHASLSLFSTSRRCSRNRSPGRLSSFTNLSLFAISASSAIDNISGGAREVISNLSGTFGSRNLFMSIHIY